MMTEKKKARVFITHMQPSKFDYTGLTEFGEIVAVTEDGERWAMDGSAMRMQKQLAARLWDFNEDRDYIVSTGSTILTAAIFTLLGRMGTGRLQLLNYQRDLGYVPMSIDIEGVVTAIESKAKEIAHEHQTRRGVTP